jgi:hypothetical protein
MDVNQSLRCDGTGLTLSFDARLNRGLYFATRDDKNEIVIQTQRKKRKKRIFAMRAHARTYTTSSEPTCSGSKELSLYAQPIAIDA